MKNAHKIPLALLMSLSTMAPEMGHALLATSPIRVEYSLKEETWKLIASSVTPGTVQRTLSYSTPGGTAYVSFSLGYDGDGNITWIKATKAAGDSTSGAYINLFGATAAGSVVGKNIKTLKIGNVGGASLTSASFRQFIAGINPTPTATQPTKSTTPSTTTTAKPTTTQSTAKPTTVVNKPVAPVTPTNTEYRKTVRYSSPGGSPEVTFALTVDPNGKILKVGTIPVSGDQTSAQYAVKFINEMQSVV